MKSVIRAAIESGRPPLELLLDEPNRERTRLDGILIKAYYMEQSYEIEGHAIWIEESPDIEFKERSRVVRSEAVVETAREREGKKKNPTPGKRFWAEPVLRPGATWPTRADWIKKHSGGEHRVDDETQLQRIAEAEARAAEKVAQNPEAAAIVAEFEQRLKGRTAKME